jgi:hypothetical protein
MKFETGMRDQAHIQMIDVLDDLHTGGHFFMKCLKPSGYFMYRQV